MQVSKRATRINGEVIRIDEDKVRLFFGHRTSKELPHRYNLVNYQDDHPERAIERDLIEKDRVSRYFTCDETDHILDVGGGVGRWGDLLVPKLTSGKYVVVDYTQDFIDNGKNHFGQDTRTHFIYGSFQELEKRLKEEGEYVQYDRILVNGVLMYINDSDIEICLTQLDHLTKKGGMVYIKESVGVTRRLTLRDYYSEELMHTYSAIYRSVADYSALITKYFLNNGYSILHCGATWDDGWDETKETSNWYWIIQKDPGFV